MKNLTTFMLTMLFASTVFAVGEPPAREKKFVDFDISGSAGNHDGQSYTELHAGINLNFTDSFTWRNSLFKRIPSGGGTEINGLDSTLRLSRNMGPVTVYAGPGYRWTNVSERNALLGEAGANLNLGRLTLGAGAKYLLYDRAPRDASGASLDRDDLSYFFVISGGFGGTIGLGN